MRSVILSTLLLVLAVCTVSAQKQEYIHLPTERLHIRYQPEQELGKQQAGH